MWIKEACEHLGLPQDSKHVEWKTVGGSYLHSLWLCALMQPFQQDLETNVWLIHVLVRPVGICGALPQGW